MTKWKSIEPSPLRSNKGHDYFSLLTFLTKSLLHRSVSTWFTAACTHQTYIDSMNLVLGGCEFWLTDLYKFLCKNFAWMLKCIWMAGWHTPPHQTLAAYRLYITTTYFVYLTGTRQSSLMIQTIENHQDRVIAVEMWQFVKWNFSYIILARWLCASVCVAPLWCVCVYEHQETCLCGCCCHSLLWQYFSLKIGLIFLEKFSPPDNL